MFKTFETVEATDGTINAQGIEILLEKEDDGQWRLVQERILPADEAKHDGLVA
jgi:ketosteroid isomerase-like protein